MHLPGLTYRGAPLDDLELLERLPAELQQLLALRNGFVAYRGAIHLRGASRTPAWHALRTVCEGPAALHQSLALLDPGDVPFGQDALGRQFVLRKGKTFRLDPLALTLDALGLDLTAFLQELYEQPQRLLPLEVLLQFETAGATLRPGQILLASSHSPHHPPQYRAVPAEDFLASLGSVSAGTLRSERP